MNNRLNKNNISNKLLRRIISFYIDIIVIMIPILVVLTVVAELWEMNVLLVILGATVFTVAFLFKDILRPSIGKRIMKMDIVSSCGSQIAAWKLIVRNLTLGLWLIEFIIISCSDTETRLTDKWLGLRVVYY